MQGPCLYETWATCSSGQSTTLSGSIRRAFVIAQLHNTTRKCRNNGNHLLHCILTIGTLRPSQLYTPQIIHSFLGSFRHGRVSNNRQCCCSMRNAQLLYDTIVYCRFSILCCPAQCPHQRTIFDCFVVLPRSVSWISSHAYLHRAQEWKRPVDGARPM